MLAADEDSSRFIYNRVQCIFIIVDGAEKAPFYWR